MIIFRMNGHWYRWNIKRLAAVICGIAVIAGMIAIPFYVMNTPYLWR